MTQTSIPEEFEQDIHKMAQQRTLKYERPAVPAKMVGLMRRPGGKKTLVVCPIGLGNYIMATPSMKTLEREIGRENLHLLALRAGVRDMAERSGYVSKIFAWDPDKESKQAGLKTIQAIRKERYDYCLMMFPSNNWRYLAFAATLGAKKLIGFDYPNSKLPRFLQTASLPLNLLAHDTDQNSDLVDALFDIKEPDVRVQDFPYEPTHPQTEQLLVENYFVLQPGSSVERGMIEKRVPPEAFATLVEQIYNKFNIKCIILGGPEQEPIKQEIASRIPDAIADYQSKDFHQLAALITHSRFYLGNDSGLMHIASALGKKCAIIYGPTDERRCGPYSDSLRYGVTGDHLILRRADLACSPCWTAGTVGNNPPCIYGDRRCVTQFDLGAAWPAIQQFIMQVVGVESGKSTPLPMLNSA